MLPSEYRPKTVPDFIGPARRAAELVEKAVATAEKAGRAPVKLLFNGKPGLGKSALAAHLQRHLRCDRWSTLHHNGTQVKVDTVEDLAREFHQTSMFDWRLLWIDEADKIPHVAQVRLLTLLDTLPRGVAVVCTSNCKEADFEERFQTRFQLMEIKAPAAEEIAALLRRWLPDVAAARRIAELACGNVRQALLDTQSALLAQ